jgi:hypothetical protein
MATATASVRDKQPHILPTGLPIGFVLGPLVGLLIWWLPLEIELGLEAR